MSKYVFKYYVRCSHGISAIFCDTCIARGEVKGEVLPLPFNNISYTREECQQHIPNCLCDGCGVCRLYEQLHHVNVT